MGAAKKKVLASDEGYDNNKLPQKYRASMTESNRVGISLADQQSSIKRRFGPRNCPWTASLIEIHRINTLLFFPLIHPSWKLPHCDGHFIWTQ